MDKLAKKSRMTRSFVLNGEANEEDEKEETKEKPTIFSMVNYTDIKKKSGKMGGAFSNYSVSSREDRDFSDWIAMSDQEFKSKY